MNHTNGRRPLPRLTTLAASVLVALGAAPAHALDPAALPTGGQVAAGSAVISQSGARMDVNQATSRAIINWSSFNIGAGALVNFAQPSTSSIALNRVTASSGASEIQGRLTANGQVFLVNPSGVLFGKTAQVDVGGLVATSLGLSDADFLASRYRFAGGGGSIVNQGTLRAADGGYIALLAPEVRNEGVISARLGTVALGAGERITLDFAGDRLVSLAIDEAAMNALVENRRIIQADGGTVLLAARSAGDLAATVVNSTGLIQAASISERNGVIRLEGGERGIVAVSGTLDASGRNAGETGGAIRVLGDKVGLLGNATLDVSGDAGGGTVLVGGNFQGKGPERNATATYVGENAQIKADALSSGNGGKVIVWADDVTRYYGSIFARGGAQAGNGGFVEVSGKGKLVFAGSVNALAPYGSAGALLLDPTNIEVVTGGAATLVQVDQFADVDLGSCPNLGAACSAIAPATINVAGANITLQATNSILFTNAIGMGNAGVGLTATATSGSITVNAPITTANRATTGTTGAVTLTAGGPIVLNAAITTGDAIVADAGGNQVPASGNITLSAGTSVSGNASGRLITGAASLTGAAAAGADTATSGTITVTAGTGAVNGGIGLAAVANALTIGSASRTGGGVGTDTATSGNIVLASRDEINNGTPSGALGLTHGSASGGLTNVGGTIRATTTQPAGNVFLDVAGPLKFGITSVAGNLSTSSTGAVSQAGVLTVTGTSAFNANANVITLGAANNFTGAVSFYNSGANAVLIQDANALVLGSGSTGGNLTITAAGAVTQTAPLTVAGTTSLTSGIANNLTLDNGSNVFSGAVRIVTAKDVTLNNNGAFSFGNGGTSAVSGNLSLTAAGAVTQANALTVTGTSSISAGANPITLTTAANNFTGAVSLSNSGANAIQVTDTNAIVLGTISTASDLTVNAVGITQNAGGIAVGGASTFSAGAGVLTLTTATNDFSGAVSASNSGANAMRITDANAIQLGTVSSGNNLTVTGVGITQNAGGLTVTGTSTFNAGAGPITLTTATNNFTGAVGLNNSGANNVAVTDANAIVLGASSVGSGTLSVTATGANTITQTGAISQAASAGAASFTTGGAAITLTTGGNNFTGPVSATNTGANNVSIADANALALGTVSTGGNLALIATGAITQSGTATVTGTTSITAGAANDITLNDASNALTGQVRIVNGNNVTLNNNAAFAFGNGGTSTVSGNLVLTAAGAVTQAQILTVGGTSSIGAGANPITLTNAANNFTGAVSLNNSGANAIQVTDVNAIQLGTVSTANNLTVTGVGITQNAGGITVGGTSTFNAGAGVLTLTTATNDFSGTVSASNSGANAMQITDANAIQLGTVTTANNLTVAGVGITQTASALTVTGTSTFNAGAGPITLTTAANNFTGAVSLNNSGANNVSITDANAIVLGASSVGTGTLTVNATGANSITQTGAITQAASAGAASFTTGGGAITLTTGANNFTGPVSATNTGASNISITDANALALGTVTTGGNLALITTGAITQTGPATVTGTTSITAGATNDVTLSDAGNALTGQVRIVNGNNVTLNNNAAFAFGNGGTSTVSGNLSLTAAGAVTQAQILTVGGTSSISAGANPITLTNAANNFTGAVSLNNSGANAIQVRDTNAIVLGTVSTADDLTVTAVGITQSAGGIAVGGASTFNAGAGVLTLTTATNDFTSAVSASNSGANAMQITDANAIQLGTLTTANNFTLVANGAITQSAPLSVGGTTSITVGAGNDITLSNAGNVLTGQARIVSGNNVTLNNNAAFAFGNGGASAISGNLSLTAAGAVTQGQALTVVGTTSVSAGSNAISLTNVANNFTGAVSLNNSGANNVAITDTNALVLGASSVGTGTLGLTAGGAITQTGAITQAAAAGTTTFTLTVAGSDVLLDTQANNFSGAFAFGGTLANVRDLALRNANAGATVPTLSTLTNLRNLTLQYDNAAVALPAFTTTAGGNASIAAGGAITQGGAAVVAGTSSFSTGSFPITLTQAANNFTGAVSLSNAGANAIQVTDVNAIVLGTISTADNLTVNAVGITQNAGGIAVGGNSTFNAGAGVLTLTTTTNDFSGAVSASNSGANAMQITDANAIQLGPVTTANNFTLVANGAVTQSAPLSVGGTTSLTADPLNDITLSDAANVLTGQVRIVSGNNVTLRTNSGFNVGNGGTSAISGNLSLTTAGAVTQGRALTVAGTTLVSAGANSISLANLANDFTGPVSASNTGANNLSIIDANALVLGTVTTGGNLAILVSGALTQTAPLTVSGTTSIAAGAANDITLSNATNALAGQVRIVNGNNVTLNNNAPFAFGNGATSAISGNLSLTAAGAVTQVQTLTVGGTSSISAGANSITLTTAANNFTGAVSLSNTGANDASIVGVNALTLGTSTIGRNLSAVAGAGLTLGGTLTTGGSSGTSIEFSGTSFTNGAGAGALAPGAGSRFLVWSSNPNPFGGGTPDNRGGLAYGFKQYNATYGVTVPGQATGNGFLYTLAPSVTPALTGTVSKTYDGATTAALAAGNYSVSGAVDGDTVTLNNPAGSYDTRNVGTGKNVSVSGIALVGATNGAATVYGYQLSATTANANVGEITQRAITVTAQTDTKTYDGATSSSVLPSITTGSLAPFGGDIANFTQAFDNRNAGTGKTLTASGSVNDGNSGNNYALAFAVDNTGVINQRAITVTAQADTRTYDGSTTSAATPLVTTGSLAPFGGDTAGLSQTFDNRNAGSGKTLGAIGSVNDGNAGNNYAITFVADNTGVINQRALTVTAQTDTKTYDGSTNSAVTPPITSGSLAPIGGDTVNFTQVFDTRNAGSGKTLTATGAVSDGNSGNNYAVTLVTDNTGVITQRALTVGAVADSKVYDATTASSAVPTITSGSLVAGDTASFAQTYDTKNVGTGKTLSAAGTISDGNSSGNYATTFVSSAAGAITARPITVTAAGSTKVYDATIVSGGAPTITSGSLAGSDTASFTQTYDTKNVGTGKALIAAGTVSDGNSGGNYATTFVSNVAGAITARPITVSAASDTKVYDGTTRSGAVPSLTAGSFVGTDAATFTQTFATRDAGIGKMLSAAASVSDGNSGNNYAITFVPSTTGVITAAALSVTADGKTRPENSPNPPLTAAFSGFKPGDSTASLGGALAFATPATLASPVGPYAITASGVTSTNYAIAFVDGVLTVTVGTFAPAPPGGITIPGAAGAIASTITPPGTQGPPAAAPSSADVLNTLAPTAGGAGDGAALVEQISPTISVVNCGIQSPAEGCGPR